MLEMERERERERKENCSRNDEEPALQEKLRQLKARERR